MVGMSRGKVRELWLQHSQLSHQRRLLSSPFMSFFPPWPCLPFPSVPMSGRHFSEGGRASHQPRGTSSLPSLIFSLLGKSLGGSSDKGIPGAAELTAQFLPQEGTPRKDL